MRTPHKAAVVAALAALLLPPAPSRGQEPQPGAAVLLWLAPESFTEWESVAEFLKGRGELKLTVGLAPQGLSASAESALSPLLASGRLEIALRLPGDPILPLVARRGRPQDALERVAAGRELYRLYFSTAPAGFVPGGGALDASLFGVLGAMGLSWTASGDYAGGGSWAQGGGVVAVPFFALRRSGPEWSETDLPASGCARPLPCVLDEAGGTAPPGSLNGAISLVGSARWTRRAWATVSESVGREQPRSSLARPPAEWPDWTGGLEFWSADPQSRRAWELYGEAAEALEGYQNSGSADLKSLESATEALGRAQASRYFRLASPPAGADPRTLEREFRGHLAAVYRRIKSAPPDSLLRPLFDSAGGLGPQGGPAESRPAVASNAVDFSQGFSTASGRSWIAFENPPGSLGRSPDGDPSSGQGWRIRSFRVEWNERGGVIAYRMGRLEAAGEGRLILDTYLDLNGVLRAGSLGLLEGRDAFVQARDAWEYALSISGRQAFLYRASPLGPPELAARVPVTVDPEAGEIRVSLPETLLKGSPSRWGYVVVSLAAGEEESAGRAPSARPSTSGSNILGLLAPLDEQKALADDPKVRRARLKAVRAPAP